ARLKRRRIERAFGGDAKRWPTPLHYKEVCLTLLPCVLNADDGETSNCLRYDYVTNRICIPRGSDVLRLLRRQCRPHFHGRTSRRCVGPDRVDGRILDGRDAHSRRTL